MRFRRKRQQKKKKKFVKLILERDGEIMKVDMKVGKTLGMMKVARKLTGLGKKGWKLVDAEGDSRHVPFIKQVCSGNMPQGWELGKELAHQAGLPGVPKKLKRFFRKDE